MQWVSKILRITLHVTEGLRFTIFFLQRLIDYMKSKVDLKTQNNNVIYRQISILISIFCLFKEDMLQER